MKSGKEKKHTSQPCIPEEYPVQTELMVADRSVFSFFVFFLRGFYCEHSEAEVIYYRSCDFHSSRKNSYGWVGAQDVLKKFVLYR